MVVTWSILTGAHFNSIKVRLKQWQLDSFTTDYLLFQFHKGTIKTNAQVMRLNALLWFQFHKGTIKTQQFDFNYKSSGVFQFHKGTIKTLVQIPLFLFWGNFNSIKVRLKQARPIVITRARQFQFHKGTIKTAVSAMPSALFVRFQFHKGTIKTLQMFHQDLLIEHFNSIKVRLKLKTPLSIVFVLEISIP